MSYLIVDKNGVFVRVLMSYVEIASYLAMTGCSEVPLLWRGI
jgi:hypothetical protein